MSGRWVAGLVALAALAGGEAGFVNVASKAGLNAVNVSGDEHKKRYLVEMNGSGMAFIDYDNDGFADLFVVNGTRFDLMAGGEGPTSHLYRNNRNGTFTDVTQQAGVGVTGWGQGACVGDYDNDGWDDLFVTFYGRNRLLHNNGDGTFRDVAVAAGVAGDEGTWKSGCAFVDYDRDGKLDLFVASYLDPGLRFGNVPEPGSGAYCEYKGVPIACGPRGLKPGKNFLYRNDGGGRFTDVSEQSGIRKTTGQYALGVLTLDYDNDGWPDIYVACDSAASVLLHNEHDGTFKDMGISAGVAYNEDGEPQAGMGVAAGDYDHDGFLDILKTNFSDDSPSLYRNNGNGTFSDRVFEAGLGRKRSYMGWGALFLDTDNDGWSDILMVNGHLTPEVETGGGDSQFRQSKLLFRNLRNGRFEDVSGAAGPAFAELRASRGAAVADLLNNGQLAVAVNEMHTTPSLLVQRGTGKNHWLDVRTVGSKSNRDGIGARVTVRAGELRQMDEVRSGGSYLSQSDLTLHFGLGGAGKVDELTVDWPSGERQRWKNIAVDQRVALREDSLEVKAVH